MNQSRLFARQFFAKLEPRAVAAVSELVNILRFKIKDMEFTFKFEKARDEDNEPMIVLTDMRFPNQPLYVTDESYIVEINDNFSGANIRIGMNFSGPQYYKVLSGVGVVFI